MTGDQISELASALIYEGKQYKGSVEETHISWIIITSSFVFKIKKPLKLSFLDFSTLPLRRHFCERELELNRRLTDIYLSVQPIRKVNGQWFVGEGNANVEDYCVVMKRLATEKRMDILLKNKIVCEKDICTLARKIADFHQHAVKIVVPFDVQFAKQTFNDLEAIKSVVSPMDTYLSDIISQAIATSDDFLVRHTERFQQRIEQGFKRDVHGDLHAGNIFLCTDPVIFDCIEFNDGYRQIDVLYEIAFLSMDLEGSHQKHLSDIFLSEYKTHFPIFQSGEDHAVFTYYKALRANIRAKVHAVSATQSQQEKDVTQHLDETRKYLLLMNRYLKHIHHAVEV